MMSNECPDCASGNQKIVDVLFRYIDRMNDICPQDSADKILGEFVAEVDPVIQEMIIKRAE